MCPQIWRRNLPCKAGGGQLELSALPTQLQTLGARSLNKIIFYVTPTVASKETYSNKKKIKGMVHTLVRNQELSHRAGLSSLQVLLLCPDLWYLPQCCSTVLRRFDGRSFSLSRQPLSTLLESLLSRITGRFSVQACAPQRASR
jgi:hypothetical protein